MKIVVVPNLLFQYIKLEVLENSHEPDEDVKYGRHNIDCIKCGFRMGEYIVGTLKCFKCGSDLD
ncbi:MAG: hypothetical protein L0H53_05840 [Candidatus Nitrosocosmicus sp.]|nr:hypothetical protein [Candidatus Nitrosocosmicus sp.]